MATKQISETFIDPQHGKTTFNVTFDAATEEIISTNLIHHETTYTSLELDQMHSFHSPN